MDAKLKAILGKLRSQLAAMYGHRMVRLVLYGSRARGDAEEGSDIDVLVVLRGEVRPGEEISRTGPIAASLSLANGVVISCAFISDRRFQQERSPFVLNVRREGVAV